VLDRAIEYGQSSRAGQNQISLLDMVEGKNGFSLTPPLPDIPEWSEGEKLAKEKEMLGFYVSGHPLEKYEYELREFTTQDIEALIDSGNGAEVRIGGIIVAFKTTIDKNGKQMAFVSVEDFNRVTEVLVFSDAYEKHKSLIDVDSMVMVRGKLSSKDRETVKIIADEVFPLIETRERYASSININLISTDLNENTINNIKEILESYRGKFSVIFHVDTSQYGKVAIRSKTHTVSLSDDLIDEFKKLVGPGNIWLE
jgi:DNA polymerase-3 subunit alpha